MRKALIITGVVVGLLIGVLFAFLAMLANVHDGYTQVDAVRDYALGLFAYIPVNGMLGYWVGRLNAALLAYMRRSAGGLGTASLFIMTVVITVFVTVSVSMGAIVLFYPIGY